MPPGQAKRPLRSSDLESKTSILRRHAAADVGREYGTRARPTQDVDMIGSFTDTMAAGVRQFDRWPQSFGQGVNLDDLSEDGLDQIEGMPRHDGQQVCAGDCLIEKIMGRMDLGAKPGGGGDNSRVEGPYNLSVRTQLVRTPHGRIQTALQPDCGLK